MNLDHITIAGTELNRLESLFQTLGLGASYGGRHSNGVTHMSVLGFDDGSYIELISTIEKGQESPWWGSFIQGDAGICAWAVEVEDVAREAARISAMGIEVTGPVYMNRQRPDGQVAEWDLAFIGTREPGTTLPFLIKDRTDRRLRITPSNSVTGTELTGVSKIVLGVADLQSSIELFRNVYGWAAPEIAAGILPGATLANFEQTPVIMASPEDRRGWLAKRLRQFGDAPCGFLIESADVEKTRSRLGRHQLSNLFGHEALWIAIDALDHTRIGFIQRR